MNLNFFNKWRTLLTASIFIMFAVVFSGCGDMNNTAPGDSKNNLTDDIAYLKVTTQIENSAARTLLPSFPNTASIADFEFTIKGKTGSETEYHALTDSSNSSDVYTSLADLEAEIFPLAPGSWTFELTAQKDGTKLSAQVTKSIQAKVDNTVEFSLQWVDDDLSGLGDFSFTLDFSGAPNKADVKLVTGQLYSYDPADGSETVLTGDDFEEWSIPFGTNCKVSYSLIRLSAGYYRIKIRFYADTEKTNLINTYQEIAIISGGQTSTGSRTINSLNEVFTITWNTDNGSSSDTFPECYTRLSGISSLPTVTKTGYVFDGWYTDSSYTTKMNSIPAGSSGDKTPCARFIDTLYVKNGGTSTEGTFDTAPLGSIGDAVSKIIEYADDSVNWKIVIDGELTGAQALGSTLTTSVANTLTLQGKTDSVHDILNGNFSSPTDDGTTLSISTVVPVTIKKLKITGGNTTTNGGGINIASGASVTIDEDALITANSATVHGGGIYNQGILTLQDGTISDNSIDSSDAANAGGAIYSTSDISMKGGVSIPFDDSIKNNDICLVNFSKINLTGSLSETGTVAAIAPDPLLIETDVVNGVTVIESTALSGNTLKNQIAKFAVNKTRNFQSNPTVAIDLMIDDTGVMSKNPWVKVSGKTFTGTETVTYNATDPAFPLANLKNSVVFIEGRTLEIPNLIVCDHEVTQAEYQRFCFFNNKNNPDYRAPGGYNDYGNGDNIPAYFVSWYDALVYCNLLSIAENLEPVYTINGKTDPKQWPNAQTNGTGDDIKYRGPSYYLSGDNDNPQKDSTWEAVTCDRSKNGYRLPTQAEWEYVARECNLQSEGQLIYSGTNDITELNYSGPTFAAVRTTKPNALGIYDMSGNVAEWCWDLAGAGRVATSASDITTSTPITGPASVSSGNEEYRVLRGGSTDQVSGNSSNYYNMAITKAERMRACAFDKQCGIRLIRTDTE